MKYHSEKLNLNFEIAEDGYAQFEDGAVYAPEEMAIVRGLAPADLRTVHEVKKLFRGKVIYRKGGRHEGQSE